MDAAVFGYGRGVVAAQVYANNIRDAFYFSGSKLAKGVIVTQLSEPAVSPSVQRPFRGYRRAVGMT
jgi:hypothetical protein